MKKKLVTNKLNSIEKEMNIKFPDLYIKYLSEEVQDRESYEIINEKEEYIYIILMIFKRGIKHIAYKTLNLIIF